jgi:hypothetical protein
MQFITIVLTNVNVWFYKGWYEIVKNKSFKFRKVACIKYDRPTLIE